jgi:hypothetical protein
MKKIFLLNCLIAGGIALIVACQEEKRSVVITKKSIILSGAQISKDDQKAINDILVKCGDAALYKVQAFDKGKPQGPPQGTMGEQYLTAKMVSAMTENMKMHKLSGQSFCLDGSASGPGRHECNGEELVERLTPIFKKYSR